VAWVDVGRGCYKVVSDHGSPLQPDGISFGYAFLLVACVSFTLEFHVLIAFA